tara:strand:- start:1844 stop:3703 length:1860 start_codon:yes stop_codon:yes gene_type:complete
MPFTKLQFRPGINREVTAYTNEGGWVDGNKIRFRAGSPETIGGWVRQSNNTFLGVCRALINWTALTGANLLGVGTNLKYYIARGGTFSDITPIRLTTAAGAATFAASNGSDTLVVSHTAHGARLDDFVTFSAAVSLGGNVTATILNTEHQITDVINTDSYEITLTVTANASDTGNGGAGTIAAYQINTGLATSFRGDGWGAGAWGEGGWGVAADTSIPGESLRLWSHATFGEDLIINPRGGGLYYWDFSLGTTVRAVDISTLVGADEVPVEVNIVKLSEQDRHVIAFGCTPLGGGDLDPLLIRFSSQENILDWNPSATDTAGDLRISSGNQITTVQQTSQQMVILTDASLHTMQFIGPPFTFGIKEVANGLSSAGPNCAIAANDTVYWMGLGEFYMYDGAVRTLPCSIKEYVFNQTFDQTRRDLVFAAHNSAFAEIWWFYPCTISGDCTRYAVYNYAQELWYYGTLPRTAWVDRGTSLDPIAAGLDGYLYSHESGINDGSTNPPSALTAYVQSSPIDLGDGDQFMFASRMIPDLTFRSSTGTPLATITLTAQNFPGGAFFGTQPNPVIRSVPVPVEQFTTQTFIRLRGRAAALRIESNQVGTQWRLGSPRLDLRTDGRR